MSTLNEQRWGGEFGEEYTMRNPLDMQAMDGLYMESYGVSRAMLNKEFLDSLNRSIKILEVGMQLALLQKIGFESLYGVELNRKAIEISRSFTKNIDIIQGSALDIPFKDHFFDLVLTSGVLIHIPPSNIQQAISEIHRCTKRYIWGFEYYAPAYTDVVYRGKNDMLWKADFAKLYLDSFADVELVKEKELKYRSNENVDKMFLLKLKDKN